jgi:glutaryl-CoA dehydrogenase
VLTTDLDVDRSLLGLDALFTDEERALRDRVRGFVRERVVPEVERWYADGHFPRDLIPEIAKLGVIGMHLDEYGCAGASAVAYGLACTELEAGDAGIRSFVSVQGSLAMFAIHAYGSEEQKQQYLPAMARGEIIGCFGLTEPEAGSDPGSMTTFARRDGSDYVLDGYKRWSTNAGIADIAIVWAKTADGVRGFIVPTNAPGFTIRPIDDKLSMRVSVSSEYELHDVRLPADAMLPGVRGLRGPLSCLNEARFGIVWGVLGSARACIEAALGYAIARKQFGKPLAAFQLTQEKLANMQIAYEKAALVALHLGRMKDAHGLKPEHVSFGKLNNVRDALEIARTARTILGGNGITQAFPVMRHMANLETVLTYEGTSEVHMLVLGHALTGISAFV